MSQQEHIQDLTLEEIIGDRFGRYSKYIIQDRALPDARDGLKPVQRRILYAMQQDHNTSDKPYKKSAKAVGNVIANYHPHGDTSVYDAMVRMSQTWKLRHELIEMQGNNGSVDGDPAAAMRYTEARLSAVSELLLADIDKKTVDFIPNFDDATIEPTVLPARFPNLLVNGSTGISAGYATDIPPHNLAEVIEAVFMRMKNPNATVDELMTAIQGPDFPTGAIIQGKEGIKKAYETGKGRCVVRAQSTIEPLKAGKNQIVFTEIPYDVNKANVVKKMDELRIDRKLDGIADIRDESDRKGLRIVVELKKDIDPDAIRNFLFKNTDLQITYNFNMVAIFDRRPRLMSLPMLLDAYIGHQQEVVTRRTKYDVARATKRLHIVEGLMKALSILDEVIETIRSSTDKGNAKQNLQEAFQFTEPQAEAIVSLQLYRLTNTDITALREEERDLHEQIARYELILSSEKQLNRVIQRELKDVQRKYANSRRSVIESEVETIEVDLSVLVPSEDVIVSVTKDGYVKRTSVRSYSASNGEGMDMKESDYLLYVAPLNTQHHLLIFTSLGNYMYQPVHELPDIRWKDLGQHLSSIISLAPNEEVIGVIGVPSFDEDQYVVTTGSLGNVKVSALKDYEVARYNRTFRAMNTKKEETMTSVALCTLEDELLLISEHFQSTRFPVSELAVTGVRTAGVRGIQLKDDDTLQRVHIVKEEQSLVLFTNRGHVKRLRLEDIPETSRAVVGNALIRRLKSNPHLYNSSHLVDTTDELYAVNQHFEQVIVLASELRYMDLNSAGSALWEKTDANMLAHTYVQHTIE